MSDVKELTAYVFFRLFFRRKGVKNISITEQTCPVYVVQNNKFGIILSLLFCFAKTIEGSWRSHNKKQIAKEAINYLVFPDHMEILILCVHEDMIGMLSIN